MPGRRSRPRWRLGRGCRGWNFAPFEHYADPVWDTVRMNNIAQHVVAGFLDRHLKGAAGEMEVAGPGLRWETLAAGVAG